MLLFFLFFLFSFSFSFLNKIFFFKQFFFFKQNLFFSFFLKQNNKTIIYCFSFWFNILRMNHEPISIHMLVMMSPLLYMDHLSAMQCGAVAINGDIANPIKVAGVQKRTYRCGVTKCSNTHNIIIPVGDDIKFKADLMEFILDNKAITK